MKKRLVLLMTLMLCGLNICAMEGESPTGRPSGEEQVQMTTSPELDLNIILQEVDKIKSKNDVEKIFLLISKLKRSKPQFARLIEKNSEKLKNRLNDKIKEYSIIVTLFDAIEWNSPILAEHLIEQGVDINEKHKSNFTPLHMAIARNVHDILDLLIKKGAHLEVQDNYGFTPLLFAIHYDKNKAAKRLLEAGAKFDKKDIGISSALSVAVNKGNLELINLLRSKGATVNEGDRTKILLIERFKAAVEKNNLDEVKSLIKKGASTNAIYEGGITPLRLAARSGNVDMIELLVENEAKVDKADQRGITPLHSAVKNMKVEAVKVLIENGAEVTDTVLKELQFSSMKKEDKQALESVLQSALPRSHFPSVRN